MKMEQGRIWQVRLYCLGLLHSPGLRLFAGVAFSGISLLLALQRIDLPELSISLSRSDPRLLILALLSVGVNTAAKAWRWQILLGEPGKLVPRGATLDALLVGQMINTLYPARLGELSRAYMIGGLGPGRVFTLGGILVEKLLDLCSYALLVLLLIILVVFGKTGSIGSLDLPWTSGMGVGMVFAVALVAVMLLSISPETYLRSFKRMVLLIPLRFRAYALQRFQNGSASLSVLARPREFAGLVFWSIVVWLTAILNNILVLSALQIHVPWSAALLVLIFLQAGISLPSVPGKIGIFEYACILALSPFQVSPAQALSFGIFLHTVVLLPTTMIGVILFFRHGLDMRTIRSLNPL